MRQTQKCALKSHTLWNTGGTSTQKQGFLTNTSASAFEDRLWSSFHSFGLIPEVELYTHSQKADFGRSETTTCSRDKFCQSLSGSKPSRNIWSPRLKDCWWCLDGVEKVDTVWQFIYGPTISRKTVKNWRDLDTHWITAWI